jgi:hypothetical protein
MSFLALELVGKRLEVLAQILPVGSRVAIIANPDHPGEQPEFRRSQIAAQTPVHIRTTRTSARLGITRKTGS